MKKYTALLLIVAILIVAIFFSLRLSNNNRSHTLTLYGNIDLRQVNLGFRVFGRLKSLYFEEGDLIKKGDLLAELDDAPYLENLKESQAKVTALKENLAYANAQLYRRTPLVKEKSVSEEDFQQAYFNQKAYAANLQQAEAQLENAKIRLEDTQLRSPSNGIIYTRVREPGTVLDIGDPIYSLALNTPIWVRSYISERDLGKIYPGMQADIYTDTPENPVYKGQVGFISPLAEFTPKNVETPDLRTNLVYQLRIIIDQPDKGLRQGMPVTVKLETEKKRSLDDSYSN